MVVTWTNYGNYEIALLRIAAPPDPVRSTTWRTCAKLLDPYFAKPRKSGVRVEMWTSDSKRVSLGRMAWSRPSFSKWCQTSRTKVGRHFIWFDAISPTWTACMRRAEMPDAYFRLERCLRREPWSHWMLLASRDDIDAPNAIETARALAASGLQPVSLHRIRGPFAEVGLRSRVGGIGMSDALTDWHGGPPASGPWKSREVAV